METKHESAHLSFFNISNFYCGDILYCVTLLFFCLISPTLSLSSCLSPTSTLTTQHLNSFLLLSLFLSPSHHISIQTRTQLLYINNNNDHNNNNVICTMFFDNISVEHAFVFSGVIFYVALLLCLSLSFFSSHTHSHSLPKHTHARTPIHIHHTQPNPHSSSHPRPSLSPSLTYLSISLSASLAQVHIAHSLDGKHKYAVKVQHEGLLDGANVRTYNFLVYILLFL